MSGDGLVSQVVRYGLVGLFVLAIDFLAYALVLSSVSGEVVTANLVGKAAGAATGFFLHRSFTFRGDKLRSDAGQVTGYVALLLFNAALSSSLLWFLVERIGLDAYWSKIGVDVLVVGLAFLGSKLLVWKTA